MDGHDTSEVEATAVDAPRFGDRRLGQLLCERSLAHCVDRILGERKAGVVIDCHGPALLIQSVFGLTESPVHDRERIPDIVA